MTRFIIPALVALLVSGPAWAEERLYICSELHGFDIYSENGELRSDPDAYTGLEIVIAIEGDRATVSWEGSFVPTHNGTVIRSSDGGLSFVTVQPAATRLYTLSVSRPRTLVMTEHLGHPPSRTFFGKCR